LTNDAVTGGEAGVHFFDSMHKRDTMRAFTVMGLNSERFVVTASLSTLKTRSTSAETGTGDHGQVDSGESGYCFQRQDSKIRASCRLAVINWSFQSSLVQASFDFQAANLCQQPHWEDTA